MSAVSRFFLSSGSSRRLFFSSGLTPLRATAASRLCPRRFASDMPKPQSMEARLFEGHPREPEGWETTIYLTYSAAAVLITLAVGFAPETGIQTWARAEAQARLDLPPGTKLEFGVHYSDPEVRYDFESKKPDNPFDEEEDDDDEDEEDEDEEEEEEEGEEEEEE